MIIGYVLMKHESFNDFHMAPQAVGSVDVFHRQTVEYAVEVFEDYEDAVKAAERIYKTNRKYYKPVALHSMGDM